MLKPLEFKTPAHLGRLLHKLQELGLLQRKMSEADAYDALRNQLVLSDTGETYLRADLEYAMPEDFYFLEVNLLLCNGTSVRARGNTAYQALALAPNASLAKAIAQIYTDEDLLFPLPLGRPGYGHRSVIIKPGIKRKASIEERFSGSMVEEYGFDLDMMPNPALEDLIWLRFYPEHKIKAKEIRPFKRDLKKLKQALQIAQEINDAKQTRITQAMAGLTIDPLLRDKSISQLDELYQDNLRQEKNAVNNLVLTQIVLGISLAAACTFLLLATLMVPPVILSVSASALIIASTLLGDIGACTGVFLLTALLTSKIHKLISGRIEAGLEITMKERVRIVDALNYKKTDLIAKKEGAKLDKCKAVYAKRLHQLERMEKSLEDAAKILPAHVPSIRAGAPVMYPMRRCASMSDLHEQGAGYRPR